MVRVTDTVGKIIDGNGNATTIEMNRFGATTRITDALNQTTVITRDDNSNPTVIIQPNGAISALTYDSAGNLLSTTDQSIGATTTFTYEPVFNQVTSITDPKGNVTTINYDAAGNPLTITDANGKSTILTYTAQGLLETITDALGNTTRFAYNATSNLVSTTDPLNHAITLSYDSAGNVTRTTDAEGKVTQFNYDLLNRLTQVIDANSNTTQYAYDTRGNLTRVTDARGNSTRFTYDAADRLVRTTDPAGLFETFTYDGNGNLISTVDRKNQTLSFTYDAINQLIQKTVPSTLNPNSLITTLEYDAVGNLVNVIDPDSNLSFTYDGANRLTSTTQNLNPSNLLTLNINYTYDLNGNRLTMADGVTGTTNYIYDTLNRLTNIEQPSTSNVINVTYDALSRRIQTTLPNGTVTNYTYDATSQLTNLAHTLGATTLSSFGYSYDLVGNRTTNNQQRSTIAVNSNLNYIYDNLYRLTNATNPLPTLPNETFQYDALGNRLRKDGQSTSAVFDQNNRLVSDEDFNYSYDNNGNMISKTAKVGGAVTSYTYDSENQLIQINLPNGDVVSYSYDGLGRRIQMTQNGLPVTRYVYDNEDIILEYDDSSVLQASYTHGLGIDEPLIMNRNSSNFYFHADGLGSIVDLTDSSGTVVQSYVYDSFGNIVSQTGSLTNPYTYTGREFDSESGLYYYRARYYDPNIGRFINEDPIGFGGGINKFVYTINNPVNFTDPSGLLSKKDCEDIAALGYSICFQIEDELDQIACLDDVGAAFEKCLQSVDEDEDGNGDSCPLPDVPPINPKLPSLPGIPTFPINPVIPINPPMSLMKGLSSNSSFDNRGSF